MNSDQTVNLAENPAEAARYALIRRLLPVLRQHMVVNLQPIGLIYEVLERKLGGPEPDLGAIREGLAKINNLARSAVNSCLDVVTWLAPDARATTGVGPGVADCLEMLSGDFQFRGFTVSSEIGDTAFTVLQAAVREVFTAALLAATDGAAGPVDLVLSVQLVPGQALVSIQTRPGRRTGFTTEMAYRALSWNDVFALAGAHGVVLTLDGPLVTLAFAASTFGGDYASSLGTVPGRG